MSVLPTNIAQSLAGASQAERVNARDRKPEPTREEVRRGADEVIVQPETLAAINSRKEGDREQPPRQQAHKHGTPPKPQGEPNQRLDMEA
jgi:hypothetical protein